MSDERGGHFPPNVPDDEGDRWGAGGGYGQSDSGYTSGQNTPEVYGTNDYAYGPSASQPAADPWAQPPAADPFAQPPSAQPHQQTGTGWPAQPPAYSPVFPAPPSAPRAKLPYGALAAVAIVAALIGGAVGGTIAATDDNGNSGTTISSLGASDSSTIKPAAAAPQGAVEQVAAKVLPSVVSIDVSDTQGLGSGSGIVISSDGLILTNNHVAGQGDLSVTFSDGRSAVAKLIKADPSTDLAVIKAQGISGLTPITFGSSAGLRVGQDVVAIGAPLGLAGTVTTGIVSALQRPVIPSEGQGGGADSVIDGIQTDAPINPGNSGGALVDLNGNLVGITSAIASLGSSLGGQSGSIGLGFAIPIDQARIIAEQLAAGKTVAHALLGVQVANSQDATQRGALIREVSNGGAAQKAGLQKGDVVTRMDDRLIDNEAALVAGVRSQQPGKKVKLTYIRNGQTKTTEATLGSDQS